MRERPIIFSTPMVRAILNGLKSQTRRVVTGRPLDRLINKVYAVSTVSLPELNFSPYGYLGDLLWVRETFMKSPWGYIYKANYDCVHFGQEACNLSTGETIPLVWKPSIHMPREASRLTLQITSTRIERLNDISEDDCLDEGINETEYLGPSCSLDRFRFLWDRINARRGFLWDDNPFVWVIWFKRIQP